MSETSPDYSQISGFYGPGTWAAWAITLFASWIPLWRDDYKYNLHYHSYALYTNWAAIDLLRQMWRADLRGGFRDMEDAHLQSFFAALAVVRVGIFHAFLQGDTCRLAAMDTDTDTATARDVLLRKRCIFIGVLLPLIVNFFVVPYWYNTMVGHSWYGYIGYSAGALTTGMAALGQSWILNRPHIASYDTGILWLLLPYIVWGTFGHGGVSCSVVPCASQKIGEWDQAFSLIVALFFFVYEFGYWMVQRVQAICRATWQWAVEEVKQARIKVG